MLPCCCSFVQLFLVCELLCNFLLCMLSKNSTQFHLQHKSFATWRQPTWATTATSSLYKKLFVQFEGRVACAWSRWLHQWPNEKKKHFQLVFAWHGIVCKSAWKVLLDNSQALIVLVFIPSLFSHFSFPFFFVLFWCVCRELIKCIVKYILLRHGHEMNNNFKFQISPFWLLHTMQILDAFKLNLPYFDRCVCVQCAVYKH